MSVSPSAAFGQYSLWSPGSCVFADASKRTVRYYLMRENRQVLAPVPVFRRKPSLSPVAVRAIEKYHEFFPRSLRKTAWLPRAPDLHRRRETLSVTSCSLIKHVLAILRNRNIPAVDIPSRDFIILRVRDGREREQKIMASLGNNTVVRKDFTVAK